MNQTKSSVNKVALVTGAARRTGAAIVQKLHAAHYNVIIHCRQSISDAHALAAELNHLRNNSAVVMVEDLMHDTASASLIQKSIDWQGRLDVLVNNASNFLKDPVDDADFAHWQTSFRLNAEVPWRLSLAAKEALKQHQGVIINLTDIHAQTPLTGYAVYCQSKAALRLQTKALARAFAPDIRVNAVAPGATVWPEGDNQLSETQKKAIIEKTALKKAGHPEYIAQAVLSLIKNPYITGQELKVDGGRSIR